MKKAIVYLLILCICTAFVPTSVFAANPPTVDSAAYLLMDADTGKIFMEKGRDDRLAMASITKLMVLLLAMEKIERGEMTTQDIVVGSQAAKDTEGSTMFIDVGEQLTVDNILKGICISSANDGAVAMAEHMEGSQEACVKKMNERAKELGMNNTNYVNVMGFDADGHYSTVYDIALLCQEIIKNHPLILEYSKIKEEWIRDNKTQLLNTNKLLSRYEYTTGLKTGTETSAKYCVAATAEKEGMRLISVVLGAPDDEKRFSGAKSMFEYGYDNYQLFCAAGAGEQAGEVKVNKGGVNSFNAVVKDNLNIVIPRNAENDIKKEVVLDKSITAPVTAGTKVGTMTVTCGETGEMHTVELIAPEDIKKATFWQSLLAVIRSLFKL